MSLLENIKAVLQYHQAIGIKGYPRTGEIEQFISYSDSTPPYLEQQEVAKEIDKAAAPLGPPVVESVKVRVGEIGEEVISCRACDLHRYRIYPVPGRGREGARLMIVGDWLRSEKQNPLPPHHIFGVEQDKMLERMLAAINLPISEVFITNIIKCAVPADCQPLAVHVKSCISYLRRQLVAVQPEFICTMGMVVSRALLESSLPLSKLRGKFHNYQLDEQKNIPLLATYHPTYLLQNPEMKRATWEDLQLLGKRMGLKFST